MKKATQKVIEFINNYKNSEDATQLANELKNCEITYLIIKDDKIKQSKGLKYISEILKDTYITSLSIASNDIRDNGMKYLTEGLKNTSITSLDVKGNDIGLEGIKCLAGGLKYTCITSLSITCNNIGDEGMKHLADSLKNTSIISLNLGNNRIRMEGIKYLANVLKDTSITSLSIQTNYFRDEGMKYLSEGLKNTSIISLEVGWNKIEMRGIQYLADVLKFTCITSLSVKSNNIGDKGMKYLAESLKNSSIISLDVGCNQIEIEGIKYLADVLRDTCITSLSIASNYFRDEGMKYLTESLKNTSITCLNVGYNNIGMAGIKYVADVLKYTNITALTLNEGISIGDRVVKYLAKHLNDSLITYLNLKCMNISIDGSKYLAHGLIDTQITEIELDCVDHRINKIASKNKILAKEIQRIFKKLVQSTHNDELEFIIPSERHHLDIGEYLYFIKKINDTPNVKAHIFNMYYKMIDCAYLNIIPKINAFVSMLSDKFNTFLQNNLPELVNLLGDGYNYVDLVKQCEDMQLPDIVQGLLLHRELYYVDDGHEILHPYIYKMLNKYGMPLCNEQIDPNKRNDIISYYENNSEIDGAQEIMDLLSSDSFQSHKRKKIL